jgi:hypothetical protein
VHVVLSGELDMFIDGQPCGDQVVAHQLVRTSLIRPSRLGFVGRRVPAMLTRAGHAVLDSAPAVA